MQELRKNGISIYVDAYSIIVWLPMSYRTFKARMVDENDRTKFCSDAYDIEDGPSTLSPVARPSTQTSMGF